MVEQHVEKSTTGHATVALVLGCGICGMIKQNFTSNTFVSQPSSEGISDGQREGEGARESERETERERERERRNKTYIAFIHKDLNKQRKQTNNVDLLVLLLSPLPAATKVHWPCIRSCSTVDGGKVAGHLVLKLWNQSHSEFLSARIHCAATMPTRTIRRPVASQHPNHVPGTILQAGHGPWPQILFPKWGNIRIRIQKGT